MFAYCRNNPVSRKDISGMTDVSVTVDDDGNPSDDLLPEAGCPGASSGGNTDASISINESSLTSNNTSQPNSSGTTIFRFNCTNPKNLMPSNKDVQNNSPMSFSTTYKPGSAMTTIEALNASGVLYAVYDGGTHVSVYPIGGTIAEWRIMGVNSVWTQTLISMVQYV